MIEVQKMECNYKSLPKRPPAEKEKRRDENKSDDSFGEVFQQVLSSEIGGEKWQKGTYL